MLTQAFFALLLLAFSLTLGIKIGAQRRALGRSPIVLGKAPDDGPWGRWFERLGPFGLLVWPATWLWVTLGKATPRTGVAAGIGIAVTAAGAAVALVSIVAMGRAWRIGIDPENRSELAERGPYRWVRHPIYTGLLLVLAGNVLIVPHPLIDAFALLTALGIAHQAHREERHLLRTFGEPYARYVQRTGRFVPRLRTPIDRRGEPRRP